MRTIASVMLDKRRPALVLTRQSKLRLLTWVTVAPITDTIRGITSEVPVGQRNGLEHGSVVSCDNITTVRAAAVGDTIGPLFDDQEPELTRAICDAFDLSLGLRA
ncbi:MAG: type II toxin-antitoxin system PemK/MazF family toxin [Acidimicrobiales bacterium]